MIKRAVVTVLLAGCLLWAGCSDSSSAPPPSSSRRPPPSGGGGRGGAPLPAAGQPLFRLPMVDGQLATVRAPAALFFFTTWCGYCKQAMPEINRLAETGRTRGWRVYGIDVNEEPAVVNGFIQQYRPNFPVLLDERGELSRQYNVGGYPTFVLIDENGRIIYHGNSVPRNF